MKTYVRPDIKVYEMQFEGTVLTGSEDPLDNLYVYQNPDHYSSDKKGGPDYGLGKPMW